MYYFVTGRTTDVELLKIAREGVTQINVTRDSRGQYVMFTLPISGDPYNVMQKFRNLNMEFGVHTNLPE